MLVEKVVCMLGTVARRCLVNWCLDIGIFPRGEVSRSSSDEKISSLLCCPSTGFPLDVGDPFLVGEVLERSFSPYFSKVKSAGLK